MEWIDIKSASKLPGSSDRQPARRDLLPSDYQTTPTESGSTDYSDYENKKLPFINLSYSEVVL